MERINPLTYALLLAAFLLLSHLMQRLVKWVKQQPPPAHENQASKREPPLDQAARRTRRAVTATPTAPEWEVRARRAPPIRHSVRAPRRAEFFKFVAGRRNLRQAIVTMTVFGPCRAQAPYDLER